MVLGIRPYQIDRLVVLLTEYSCVLGTEYECYGGWRPLHV